MATTRHRLRKLTLLLCGVLAAGTATAGGDDGAAYEIAPPDGSGASWSANRLANACQPPENPAKAGLSMAFACPRLMLGSPAMLAAARADAAAQGWWAADGSTPYFTYGVVGRDPAPDGGADCCACFQLALEPPASGSPAAAPLLVQWVNTGAAGCHDPANGQCDFDLFVGAGGSGNFNACLAGQSNSSTFGSFMYTAYPWDGQPWNGGVSDPADCSFQAPGDGVAAITAASCRLAIDGGYKGNPATRWQRVACPDGMVRATGCRRADDATWPAPAVAPDTRSWLTGYVTSMQDCCLPSCGWTDNVPAPAPPWTNLYGCDAAGTPWTLANPVPPPPAKVHDCCSWDGCQSCGSSAWCNRTQTDCRVSCGGTWCP